MSAKVVLLEVVGSKFRWISDGLLTSIVLRKKVYKLFLLEARREEVSRFLRKRQRFSPRVIIIVEFD